MQPAVRTAPPATVASWVAGTLHTDLISAEQTGGAFTLCEDVVPPQAGPPPHVHTREDEAFYVLEGTFEFMLGGETIRAEAGFSVLAPRLVPHTWRNVGETTGRLLTVISPSGFERYLAEAGTPADPALPIPPIAGPDVQRLLALAPAYGLRFLPPEH